MQQSREHTLKAFDEDLDRLRALISEMGGLAEHAIGEAMRCLIQRDLDGAQRVVERRQEARHAGDRDGASGGPADRAARADGRRPSRRRRCAQDLRRRRADRRLCQEHRQARSAARECRQDRAAVAAAGNGTDCGRRWCTTCSTLSSSAMRKQRCGYAQRDDAVDDFYDSIFRTLLTHMMENPQNIGHPRTCCSWPRTSSASATTRPTSPRWSIMQRPAST